MQQKDVNRFVDKISAGDSCWQWTGAERAKGYGSFYLDGKNHLAHRVAFKLFRHEIQAPLVVDHICRNTGCVNPDHMELVHSGVNTLRGLGRTAANARKTHCKRGHLLSDENTREIGHTKRRCLLCKKEYRKKYYAEKSK